MKERILVIEEEFKRLYPNVNMQIQAAGPSATPPALTEATSNLGPMSRQMTLGEIAVFENRHGYKPVETGVVIDSLAVYVRKDSPVEGMTIPQVTEFIKMIV